MSIRRVRDRVTYPVIPDTYYGYINGLLVDQKIFNKWKRYYWMRDTIRSRDQSSKKHRSVGYCQHLKIDKIYEKPSLTWIAPDGNSVTEFNIADYYSLGMTGDFTGQSPTGSLRVNDDGYGEIFGDFLDTPRFKELCIRAFNKSITQIPAATSIINFGIEALEFKEIFKGLSRIPNRLKAKPTSRVRPRVSRNAPKKVVDAASSTLLAWNFQWAPFISDIVKFMTSIERTTKRLEYLRVNRGKDTIQKYYSPDCYSHPSLNQVVRHLDKGDWHIEFVLSSYRCDFAATWNLFEDLQGLDDTWALLRGVMADLGINNPAKIIWNAIPFSFLLDWVAPWSSFLDRTAVQPFGGVWDVSTWTTSVHEIATVDMYVHPNFKGNPRVLMQTIRIDRYTRLDFLPMSLGSIDFSQLTDTQQKLALALVYKGLVR